MKSDSDLRVRVVGVLPVDVAALLMRIEATCHRQIEFGYNDAPAPSGYASAAASFVREDRACILLREQASIDAQNVLHELLHIHRYWVERVPQVEPIYDHGSNWDITGRIENSIEHQVIVPLEADFGFSYRDEWIQVAEQEWSAYPWPRLTDTLSRKLACVLGWLNCLLLPHDHEIRKLARRSLEQEEMLVAAQRVGKHATTYAARNKPKALLSLLRAVDLPRADFRLAYLDPKLGKKVVRKLPLL